MNAPSPAEAELEMFDTTPMPPPVIRCPPIARPNALARAWSALRRFVLWHYYEGEIACLVSERRHYAKSKHPRIGPEYRAESDRQLMDLRNKQAWLEIET